MNKTYYDFEIRLIESKNDWDQFIEITKINFPEDIKKVEEEGIEYHQQEGCYLFGIFDDDKLLGTIGIKIVTIRSLGIIGYLQVKKEYRNKGIAKKLFLKVKKLALNKECKYLYLAVYAININTISIYKHWGFFQVPMIYNIKELLIKDQNSCEKKIRAKKRKIKTERELEKIITQMFTEYYHLNEIYHYFELMYNVFTKNALYIRKLFEKINLVVIYATKDYYSKNLIFILKESSDIVNTLKKELTYIKNNLKKEETILIGKLKQKEITELENFGIKFVIPIETKGLMLKLRD